MPIHLPNRLLVPAVLVLALSAAFAALAAQAAPPSPAAPANAPTVVAVWGGARHCIVLLSDGTVWDWGMNWFGKLGDNTFSVFPPGPDYFPGSNDRHTPIQVHGPGDVGYLTHIIAIMGGESDNLALKDDGTVWAWGGNSLGQLGDGTHTDRYVPVQVSGLVSVTALGGRGYHSLAAQADGSVWAWGFNSTGQLGNNSTISSSLPVQVVGLSHPLTVTGGYNFSLALLPDHSLRAWGGNGKGQLGIGSNAQQLTPVAVGGLVSVTQVSAGWEHALALTADGHVWAWGQNDSGEVGNGLSSSAGVSVPVQVAGLSGMRDVSAGDCHSAALKAADGTVWTWGCNGRGQLGDGSFITSAVPVQVVGLSHVVHLAARDYHNIALKDDGTLWTWGWNINGQLGDGTTINRNVPVQVLWLLDRLYLPLVRG